MLSRFYHVKKDNKTYLIIDRANYDSIVSESVEKKLDSKIKSLVNKNKTLAFGEYVPEFFCKKVLTK